MDMVLICSIMIRHYSIFPFPEPLLGHAPLVPVSSLLVASVSPYCLNHSFLFLRSYPNGRYSISFGYPSMVGAIQSIQVYHAAILAVVPKPTATLHTSRKRKSSTRGTSKANVQYIKCTGCPKRMRKWV